MTNAEEELQKSVILSEEDAEFEDDDGGDAMAIDSGNAAPATSQPPVPAANDGPGEAQLKSDALEHHLGSAINKDVAAEEKQTVKLEQDVTEQDQPSEAALETDAQVDYTMHLGDDNTGGEDDASGEDDAEGEEDEAADAQGVDDNTASDDETDDPDEEDEAEGVGAVKIKPGETEDEESDSGEDASTASVVSDRESAAEWEDTVENDDDDEEEEEEADEADEEEGDDDEEDDEDDEDDASAAADAKACMLCKGSEGDTPNVESEPLLACKGCGEHGKPTRLPMPIQDPLSLTVCSTPAMCTRYQCLQRIRW